MSSLLDELIPSVPPTSVFGWEDAGSAAVIFAEEESRNLAIELVAPAPLPYADDPIAYARERLGVTWWSKQEEVARSVVEHRYTAVQASHDTGKTHGVAGLAQWWIESHPVGEALVLTTAPTWQQVRTILWKEIRSQHGKAKGPGRINLNCEWHIGDNLVAFGRKPADNDPAAFSGHHALWVLVIIDEAGGVDASMFDAVDTAMTNENARCVAIGNPDDAASPFFDKCKPGSGWNVIHIDGLRSPNFTKEEVERFPNLAAYMEAEGIEPTEEVIPDEIRPYLLSPLWVSERIKRWGVMSPMFRAKVRGLFSEVSTDTLFPPGVLRIAIETELSGRAHGQYAWDIARYGSDETVGYRNRGGQIRIEDFVFGSATTATAGRIASRLDRHNNKSIPVVVDGVGVGAGVVDMLAEDGYTVIEFSGGSAPRDPKLFVDRRSEVFWQLREDMQEGLIDLDPEDEDLLAQLGAINFFYNRHGQIRVESKDEMKKRNLPSPDRADAVSMSIVDVGWLSKFEADRASLLAVGSSASLTDDLLERRM